MKAYRRKDGKWVVYTEHSTHTGHHRELTYSDDINHASVFRYLDRWLRLRLNVTEIEGVEVKVTRIVEIL